MKVKVKSLSHVRLFVTPWTVASRLLCPWDSPGKSTGVGCHFLLQGIFPTQGSNSGLPHCKQTFYHPSRQGSPQSRVSFISLPLINFRNLPHPCVALDQFFCLFSWLLLVGFPAVQRTSQSHAHLALAHKK